MIDHDNLEEFADAVNYDNEDSSDTGVAFYSALAQRAGGPVLEIACGTGRVAIPIARLGLAVTGLDIVPGMLAQARRKAGDLPARWVEGDGRDFDLGQRFRFIFLTGNAFQAFLTNADQRALLGCVRAHLHDDGLFAFETRNPLLPGTQTRPGLFLTLETKLDEMPGAGYVDAQNRPVRVSRTQVYDPVAQILHLTAYKRWDEGGIEQTRVTRIALRYTFPQELAALLAYTEFEIVEQYGDWNREPLTATSPSIICVCRRAAKQIYGRSGG